MSRCGRFLILILLTALPAYGQWNGGAWQGAAGSVPTAAPQPTFAYTPPTPQPTFAYTSPTPQPTFAYTSPTPIPGSSSTYTPQAVTCASTGNSSLGALTITPSSAVVNITNADADGCDLTLSEASAVAGNFVTLVVISNAGGTVNLASSAGVVQSSGTFNMDVHDEITLVYSASAWHEVGRSNNQ